MKDAIIKVPRENSTQSQLFYYSPQEVCDELNINWMTAIRLHEAGWLSFDPARVLKMNEAQETEFRFLGVLSAAGCDDHMLTILLKPLQKPYLYSLNRIYFDWQCGGRWQPVIKVADFLREPSQAWIEKLKEEGNIDMLEEIFEWATDALDDIRGCEE